MHQVDGLGGGVLTVVRNLAEELATRHDVELISVLRRADDPYHRLPDGVKVRMLADVRPSRGRGPREQLKQVAIRRPSRLIPPAEPHHRFYSLYSDLQLRRYLRSVKDGVVVGMQPGVNIAVAKLARRSVVRIGQDHRPFVVRRGKLLEPFQESLPRLDMFLTLTTTDARHYRKVFKGSPKVQVMPNATPLYAGPPSDNSQKVVTAAGHLKMGKGFDRLIEAWALVHQQHPDWELRIFGKGRREGELAALITERGLQGSVRLMGYSKTLFKEMASSSIFVLSSRVEGYGMVLVEAMACGVPVISFDCPSGPRDIITDGKDGFLVPNGDIEGMADAINRMIDLGPERAVMGAAALETARSRSQPEIARRWERLFEELASSK